MGLVLSLFRLKGDETRAWVWFGFVLLNDTWSL